MKSQCSVRYHGCDVLIVDSKNHQRSLEVGNFVLFLFKIVDMFVSVALQMRSLVLQILSTRTDGIHPPAKRSFIKLFLLFAGFVIC